MYVYDLTGPPSIQAIPPVIVKDGDNFTVICRVVHSFDSNYEMSWQTSDGSELDSFSTVKQISDNELRLFVKKVTKATGYVCVIRNNSRILTTEHVRVYVTNVPSPPRNLEIRSTGSAGHIFITWTAPETDNGSPLTTYYINITVEGANAAIVQIIPDTTSLDYFAGCNKINVSIMVSIMSENACGNSSAINSSIDISDQCGKITTSFDCCSLNYNGFQ